MTRSEAALKRRAAKRNRSIEEQRLKDNMEDGNKINSNNDNVKKRKMEDNNNNYSSFTKNDNPNNIIDPLKEDGAWICPTCGNHNFASRKSCNSKTCKTIRPGGFNNNNNGKSNYNNYNNNNTNNKKHYKIISKGGFNIMVSKRRTDNNGNASKVLIPKLKWPEQAGPERIKYNQNLRERYNQDQTSLDDKELERALILIKRDQRKKEKKLKQKIERERKKEMRRIRKERHNALINQSKK